MRNRQGGSTRLGTPDRTPSADPRKREDKLLMINSPKPDGPKLGYNRFNRIANGDFEHWVTVKGQDELAKVKVALQQMRDYLPAFDEFVRPDCRSHSPLLRQHPAAHRFPAGFVRS